MKALREERDKPVYEWRDGYHLGDKMDAQKCGETVDRMRSLFPDPRGLDEALVHDARREEEHAFRACLTLSKDAAWDKCNRIEVRDAREQLRLVQLIEQARPAQLRREEDKRLAELLEVIREEGVPGKAHRTFSGKVVRMDEALRDKDICQEFLARLRRTLMDLKLSLMRFKELADLVEPIEEALRRAVAHSEKGDSARQ